MAVSRSNDHFDNHGSIIFQCDEVGCDEEFNTGYTTWNFALACVKKEGWYVMPDGHDGWDHLCEAHGKARWIAQKRAADTAREKERAEIQREPGALPWWIKP